MVVELLLTDRNLTFESLDELASYDGEVNKICSPTSLLPFLQGINRKKLAGLIDYPYGLASTKTRLYEIAYAAGYVSTVDLPINSVYVTNRDYDAVFLDLETCIRACRKHSLNLRVILEYSLYDIESELQVILDSIGRVDIDGIITSTGILPSASREELLLARDIILSTKQPVYVCNVFSKNLIQQFKNIRVTGLRFSSINFYRNVRQYLK
jgi:deoxyribose-phosphate aldolase